MYMLVFFFSSRRRHTRWTGDWSSDVCSSDLWLIDALDRHLGQMFDKFENLVQLPFGTRAGQLDGPAEIALAGIQLLQRWQLLGVQLADAHRPQSGQVAQQHNRIGSA